MRQILCLLLIVISSLTFGQTEFSIHLKSDVHVDQVSVSSFNLSKNFTSAFENGIAIVEIPSPSSDQYSILIGGQRIDGWFNSGKVAIYLEFENNHLIISKTKNSPVYKRQVAYFDAYNEFLNDTSIGTGFIKNTIIENDQDAFVLVPINHYLKLNQNDKTELSFIERFLNKQPLSTKEHSIYSMISSRIKKLQTTNRINLEKYPLIATDGNRATIETNSNLKFTVLDFWFTACPPCLKEHKAILANSNMFANLNAELIGISTDANQEKWVRYLEKKNAYWKNYRIGEMNLDKDLGIWSFPTYIILDKEQNIIGSYSNLDDTIEALKR